MNVTITLKKKKKNTINKTINIIMEYRKYSTETGAAYMETLTLVNNLCEWLNERI